jgi:hypothetical protein
MLSTNKKLAILNLCLYVLVINLTLAGCNNKTKVMQQSEAYSSQIQLFLKDLHKNNPKDLDLSNKLFEHMGGIDQSVKRAKEYCDGTIKKDNLSDKVSNDLEKNPYNNAEKSESLNALLSLYFVEIQAANKIYCPNASKN